MLSTVFYIVALFVFVFSWHLYAVVLQGDPGDVGRPGEPGATGAPVSCKLTQYYYKDASLSIIKYPNVHSLCYVTIYHKKEENTILSVLCSRTCLQVRRVVMIPWRFCRVTMVSQADAEAAVMPDPQVMQEPQAHPETQAHKVPQALTAPLAHRVLPVEKELL